LVIFDFVNNSDVITTGVDRSITQYKKYAYIVLFYKGETNNLPLLTNGYQCDFKNSELSSVKYLDENINIKIHWLKLEMMEKKLL